jgi:hypothetical protein
MSLAVRGIYKGGKVKLLEKFTGIKEADVVVVVTRKRKTEKKKNHTGGIIEALHEVKMMRKGRLPERDWQQARDDI